MFELINYYFFIIACIYRNAENAEMSNSDSDNSSMSELGNYNPKSTKKMKDLSPSDVKMQNPGDEKVKSKEVKGDAKIRSILLEAKTNVEAKVEKTKKCKSCKKRKLPLILFINGAGRECKTCKACRTRDAKYRQDNRDKLKSKSDKKKKKLECPHGKKSLRQCKICDCPSFLKTIVRRHCTRGGHHRSNPANTIGLSMPEYKTYLEEMWEDDMSWENYPILWNIDHKIPLNAKDKKGNPPTLEEQYERLNYLNTTPMYTYLNARKGNKKEIPKDAFEKFKDIKAAILADFLNPKTDENNEPSSSDGF